MDAKIVLLTEFGETVPDKALSALAMPVYSVTIANVLNGSPDSFSYNESDESVARFTAPSAAVLVVDDITTNLKVAHGLMLPYKMRVDLRKSGVSAIEAIKSERYDVVFMDHRMPEMDGVEATQLIRALAEEDPYYANVPIIALTANAVSGTREMFLANGFDDFLSKPIDTVKLNSVLERWIPKEKQIAPAGNGALSGAGRSRDLHILDQVEGLDAAKGLALAGGTIDLYFDVLLTFCDDGLEKIQQIRECQQTGNLSLYATYVHALKSASANVGADALSESAKALENAGRMEDRVYISARTGVFLRALEGLIAKIKGILSARHDEADRNASPNLELFESQLLALKAAIENFDGRVINSAVNSLQKLAPTAEAAATVRGISKNILLAEYDEATVLIESLLRANT
jgi:CheY-like chemotaxis protein/HPt (histidine-containing phosphotransfer) domain-containing protein